MATRLQRSRPEAKRKARQKRVRKDVLGTNARPRLCVYKSIRYTYAQFISDETGVVLGSASTRTIAGDSVSQKTVESAKKLGVKMAEIAKEKKISAVVFDRNGYKYHGRVSAVAEGAREGGLEF